MPSIVPLLHLEIQICLIGGGAPSKSSDLGKFLWPSLSLLCCRLLLTIWNPSESMAGGDALRDPLYLCCCDDDAADGLL